MRMESASAEDSADDGTGSMGSIVREAMPSANKIIVTGVLLAYLMMLASGGVTAQQTETPDGVAETEEQKDLKNTLQAIGNFIAIIVVGIAVPNGAYGFLQYMTAGSNVEKDERGRERIRNTFIALAGIAVINIAVRVFTNFVM